MVADHQARVTIVEGYYEGLRRDLRSGTPYPPSIPQPLVPTAGAEYHELKRKEKPHAIQK